MITPLQDYVLLEECKEVVDSGFIIPDSADVEAPVKAKIVAQGDDCKLLKSGDIVLFKRYGFDEITIDKIKYLIGKEENIVAKYDN